MGACFKNRKVRLTRKLTGDDEQGANRKKQTNQI